MTRDQKIRQNLAKHFRLMNELREQGYTKEEASSKAFAILQGKEMMPKKPAPDSKILTGQDAANAWQDYTESNPD